jgi:hypothetical protein
MKTKIAIAGILFSLIMSNSFSQEKSKKELKAEQKLERQKQTEAMVNAKEFVFIGRTALPQGARSVDLTTRQNFVKFHPELIESEMPYFGRAYAGAGFGGDTGLKFKGKPEEYTLTRNNKNFMITAKVKGERDTYNLSLSVGFEGNASLSISSNNRSTISYNGDITAPEKPKEK